MTNRGGDTAPAFVHLILILFFCCMISACTGPGYYYQAASGHFKLMRAREDVGRIINDPESDPELVMRLQAANEILAFAESDLGLPSGESYETYVETGRDAVVWKCGRHAGIFAGCQYVVFPRCRLCTLPGLF